MAESVLERNWFTTGGEADERHPKAWFSERLHEYLSLSRHVVGEEPDFHEDFVLVFAEASHVVGRTEKEVGAESRTAACLRSLLFRDACVESLRSRLIEQHVRRFALGLFPELPLLPGRSFAMRHGQLLDLCQRTPRKSVVWSWHSSALFPPGDEGVGASYERLDDPKLEKEKAEQELWGQKTVPELIKLLGQFETDRRAANIAAAYLEHLRVPNEFKPTFRQTLEAFIANTMRSRKVHDQVALRCALRRYIYIQGDTVFAEVERLIQELPPDPPANSIELITTFAEFLWIRTPSKVIDAPVLVATLVDRCFTSLVNHLLSIVEVRVIAIQSLLALILMGRPEAEELIDKALELGPARRYLMQRAEDLMAKLSEQKSGTPETRELLNRILTFEA